MRPREPQPAATRTRPGRSPWDEKGGALEMRESTKQPREQESRLPYQPPTMISYGSVVQLTRGGA